jgi:hypothetical protein
MVSHYYQCDKCGLRVPIVWLGYGSGAGDEFRDRLPDGWALVFSGAENQSYCSDCWAWAARELRAHHGDS